MDAPFLLASASPRRRRLLAVLGIEYAATAVDVPEDIPDGPVDPLEFATGLARDKALAARVAEAATPWILAADTIVVHGGRILGKPADLTDAVRMLEELSGEVHQVVTGVALLAPGATEPVLEAVVSDVRMHELTRGEIDRWVDAGELLGCAGAYNIESHLASVELTECYQNVAGLPLCHVYRALEPEPNAPAGLASPVVSCDALRGVACQLGPQLTGDSSGD